MYGSLDISTSGMIAQRTRMTTIAANIATKDARDADGLPYRRRMVMFSAGNPSARTEFGRTMGVHVRSIQKDQAPFNLKYDPSSPFAYKTGAQKGYVPMTNINTVVEQLNAMETARAYEANVMAAEATKTMMAQALRLIA